LVIVTNTSRDGRLAAGRDQRLERVDVEVALERVQARRVLALGDHQVDRLGAGVLDVGAGGVEVGVVRHDLARPADHREQDLLGGAALVGRDDVGEREQLLHRRLEAVPRRRAGVALVAVLHRRPLIARHRAGAGVGQQIDQHVVGVEREQVVAGLGQPRAALLERGEPNRLDRVDAKRLDDGLEAASSSNGTTWPRRRRRCATRSSRRCRGRCAGAR
jgi:hypothetical protein